MEKTKRILFIAHDSRIEGGANRSLITILTYFNSRDDYSVLVMVPNHTGDFVDYLNLQKIEYIVGNYSWQLVSNNNTKKVLKSCKLIYLFAKDCINGFYLSNRIKKYKVDLIYTNTRVIYIGNFLSAFLKVPHIMHCREFIDQVMHRRSIPFSEWFINKTTDKIICISKVMKKVYPKLEDNKISVIYNGIPFSNTLPVFDISNKEKIKLLLAGRFSEVKGQLDAIKAVHVLRRKYKVDADLFLAGSGGEADYNNQMKELIDQLDIKDKIHIIGEVKDMKALRKEIDVELVCSKFEAFGRVTIEALDEGKPVVAANAPATNEIIIDNYNGLLYDSGDEECLADKIYLLLSNDSLRKNLIKNGLNAVKTKFSDTIMLTQIEELIRNTINEGEIHI